MYATATLETRKALTSKWDGLERLYQRYNELNDAGLGNLDSRQKHELVDLRERICLMEFDCVESPSLRIQKFVHLGDNTKRFECDALANAARRSERKLAELVARFQLREVPGEIRFVLKLQGRMIVNHTGGVLENAGLCLHPHAGVPYVPGTAVKGAARHAAWCRWADAVDEEDHVAAKAIALKTALVFGFPTNDEEGLDRFCAETWPDRFGSSDQTVVYAGLFAFMPAMPMQNMALVTDIVNGHHSKYYQGKQKNSVGNERPNPQFFPAVERGSMFTFSIRPLSRSARVAAQVKSEGVNLEDLSEFAESCLREAAEAYGFGSKTSNGYGWFSEDRAEELAMKENAVREEELARKREAQAVYEAEQKRLREEKKQREAELAKLSPSERADCLVAEWNEGKWNSVLANVAELNRLDHEIQSAIVRALAVSEAGRWDALKQKAQSGKKKEKKAAIPVRDLVYGVAKKQNPKVKMP